MENKKEPQAIQYFFRLLDIEGHGYLTAFSLQYFFRVRTLQQCIVLFVTTGNSKDDGKTSTRTSQLC